MDLLDILPILRRRWLIVASTVGLAVAFATVLTLVTPVTYQARTEIFVATASSGNAADLAQGTAFAQARVQSYLGLVKGPQVLGPVVEQLHLAITPTELATHIEASAPVGKVLLDLVVSYDSAERSAEIANAVARQFVSYVSVLEVVGGKTAPVRLTVIRPAEEPAAPVSPKGAMLTVLAVLGGLVLGGALAVLRELTDTKVRSVEDLAFAGTPVLATIPYDRHAGSRAVATTSDPDGPRAEAFRQLRTTLDFIDVDHPPKVIAVVGPGAGEGRTTTALNLAASLADAGHRVCLVETDLRSPGLAHVLGLSPPAGLVDVLVRRAEAVDVLQSIAPNLAVIVAGSTPPNPNELLSTERVRTIVSQIAAVSDYVVLDTPPLLTSSDGAQVARLADATLLVVRAGSTRRGDVTRAVENVRRVDRSAAGIVLTMVRSTAAGYGRTSSYHRDRDVPRLARDGVAIAADS